MRVRLIIGAADRVAHRHMTVLLKMREGTFRRIDRQMSEVRPAQTLQLRVEIEKVAALEQRIVGKIDARRHVLGHERNLLGLGEEIVGHTVEHQPADRLRFQDFFGNDLGGIEHVEIEAVGECLVEELELQFPLRIVAGLDGIPQITAMEIGIGAVDLDRLVSGDRLQSKLRLPVKLDEGRLAFGIDEAECVDPETLHKAEGAGNGAIRHDPHDHIHAFRRQAHEIPEIVVGCLRLRKRPVRLLLGSMDQIGELDGILDEEYRDIVANQIPVAFLRIDLDREAAHVANKIGRALVASDRGEAHESRRFLAGPLEEIGLRIARQRSICLEEAMSAVTARMHHTFGNALVVEVEDLLAEMEIVDDERSLCADAQRVLVIGNRPALGGGQDRCIAFGELVQLAAGPVLELLVMHSCCRGF